MLFMVLVSCSPCFPAVLGIDRRGRFSHSGSLLYVVCPGPPIHSRLSVETAGEACSR